MEGTLITDQFLRKIGTLLHNQFETDQEYTEYGNFIFLQLNKLIQQDNH